MSNPFNADYAEFYDLVYGEKDYEMECDVIDTAIKELSSEESLSLVDFGCGTARHGRIFASKGYSVFGVDRSKPMLETALVQTKGLSIEFAEGDIETVDLGKTFDVATCMFAVLGYKLENKAVEATLRNFRKHLVSGGLLFFDVWYGPAVLNLKPEIRESQYQVAGGVLKRRAVPRLDTRSHQNSTDYTLNVSVEGEAERAIVEKHTVRYFFPMEIEYFLSKAGFSTVRMGAFPDSRTALNEENWNVSVIAKRID